MSEMMSDIADALGLDWLFPMSSSELASWLQGIGTVLAVAVTLGLTLRETRARRRDEEMAAAYLVGGWIYERFPLREPAGPGVEPKRVGVLLARVRNDGHVTARQLQVRVVVGEDQQKFLMPRVRDSLLPGEEWNLEWWLRSDHPAMRESQVDLQLWYTVNAKRWRQVAGKVKKRRLPTRAVAPMWVRELSHSWDSSNLSGPEGVQSFRCARAAMCAAVAATKRESTSRTFEGQLDVIGAEDELKRTVLGLIRARSHLSPHEEPLHNKMRLFTTERAIDDVLKLAAPEQVAAWRRRVRRARKTLRSQIRRYRRMMTRRRAHAGFGL